MSELLTHPTARRGFVGRLLAGLAAAAGTGLAAPAAAAQGVARAATSSSRQLRPVGDTWDMSWVDRVTGTHRQVFDAPEIAGGTALHQALIWMDGYAEVYGAKDADTSAVIVARHAAIPYVLDDALWAELDLGRALGTRDPSDDSGQPLPPMVKDPTTGEPARRNPFLSANVKKGDRYAPVGADGGLDALIARGAIVLACNRALRYTIYQVSQKSGLKSDAAREHVLAHLVPGVIVMPSGIFAVARAEEAGCRYIRAT